MKNFTKQNFKTNPLWIRLLIMTFMLLAGAGNVWAANEYGMQYLYVDCKSFTSYTQVNADMFWQVDCNEKAEYKSPFPTCPNDNNVFYVDLKSLNPSSYAYYRAFEISQGSGWWNKKCFSVPANNKNNSIKISGWGAGSWSNFALTPSSVTLKVTSGTTGGTGTQNDPYLVEVGSQFTLSASSLTFNPEDPVMVGRYSFGTSTNSEPTGTSTTSTQTASSTANTTTRYYVSVRGYYNGAYSSSYKTASVYVKAVASCATATLSWADTFDGSMKVTDVVTNPASLDNSEAANSISYTSSNPDVISVNGTTLTALKSGKATITASATSNEGFCSIKSIDKEVTVTCDVVNTEDIKIEVVYTGDGIPSIWAWEPDNGNNNLTGGNWPGQAMTPKGNNVYSWETKPTSDQSVSIIISGGDKQTVDIDGLQIGKRYKFKYDPTNGEYDDKGKLKKDLLEEDCLAPACTTPSAPNLSKYSDTTCPNVNYTLPTATNKGSYTQKWYNSNGTEVTSPVKVSAQTKYTTKLINGTCESEATDFTLYVTQAPSAPSISIGSEKICNGEKTFILVDSPLANHIYKLFKDGNEVANATLNNENKFIISEEGSYTVKVTAPQAGCGLTSVESDAKTLAVTSVDLTLDPTSAPICSGAKIADISKYVTATTTVTPSGSGIASVNWYASEDATEELTDNTELKAQFYYAEAVTTSGCKSGRQSFEVASLMNAPSAPVIKANKYAVCSGESVELTLEYNIVGEKYTINDSEVFANQSITWTSPTLDSKTEYIVTAYNSCGSTDSEKLTINVTTTPTITGPSATQPNKEITLSSEAGANTKWETTSGSTLTPETGAETVFTATENGNYIITAKNTDNNITCSATHSIVVNDKFYIYIRRPKSGTTTYDQWYEKTNDADKGAHPWMKNGSEYKTGDDYTNNNYDGNGPESTFTDCNGYVWDAFIAPGTSFFIHAPNTFQEGGQVGYATFTQVTNITSTATDLYYTINEWASNKPKGTTLSPASEPNRIPEVAVPVLSINPVSGIICQGAEATITVTNPENGVSYKLNYEGKDQTTSIAYTGTGNVEFAVTEAGTYLVKAETTNGTCKGNAVSIAREIQVITTSISFEGAPYITTPWEPITITVNIPKGYNYTFDDTQLTQIASPDTPIKKVSGSEYTYSFPRPQEWGTGNSQTGDSWGEKSYTISATLNGVTETCGTATATVKLQDEGNDNCRTTNN